MKRYFSFLFTLICALGLFAQSEMPANVMLTPYVINDANTPRANKILLDKLNRIVSEYGVSSPDGLQTPFILTAHAIELDKETTATLPPQIVVNLSVTFYIGNGEEDALFSTCNMELKGVGENLDQAYVSAFKKIKVKSPLLMEAIYKATNRIREYYEAAGPSLINKAEAQAKGANFAEAYAILLRIPKVCPQYDQAQKLLLKFTQMEADTRNNDLLGQARAAWSASPDQAGASKASTYLGQMSNVSPTIRKNADALSKEMSTKLGTLQKQEHEAQMARDRQAHEEEMAAINGATKVAAAYAAAPTYVIHWW